MAASSSSGIVERQYNYGGLIVRTFVHSAKSSPPPALGTEDSQSSPLNSSTPNNQATSPVKRGRGRPRKNPKPNSVADDDDAVSDKSSQPASSSQQKPPKKKRKHLGGVTSGNSRVPAYVSLLTEEEMTAVRKRNRRGKQWIPGEKTVMNELARLGRSVPDLTETQHLQNGEDGIGDDEEPEAEFDLAEGIEPADDDVIDCDPFTELDDMRLDSTDNAGMTGGVGSSSAAGWMRANNEPTQFQQQQTEGNGESSFDYYMCPPNGASTLEPPSAALDKDSSFAEQLNSVVPELSEPILRPSDSVTTLSHPTPPPSSLSPQNPPPKRPAAPPPPAIHVDTTAALGAKLIELIAASQTAFIPTLVHCSFTLPLSEGEFTQKQYATDLVSAISDVDRYVYVTKNSTWNSTNSGSRGAIFVCNMSLESLKKRKSGTEDQKKVSMARTRYPCEGCITIRFLAKKNVISVLYKHHAIHRSPYDKIEDSETAPENNTTTNTVASTKDALPPLEKPPAEEIIVPALAQIPSIAGPG